MNLLRKAILTVGVAALSIAVANADTILISVDDRTESPFITMPDGTVTPFSDTSGITATALAGGGQTDKDLYIEVLDPGTISSVSGVSDVILLHTITNGFATLWSLTFFSDGETPISPLPAQPPGSTLEIITETGDFQTIYDSTAPLVGGGTVTLTFQFASDVEAVPEPATLALLGIGLAGVGFSRRRKLS